MKFLRLTNKSMTLPQFSCQSELENDENKNPDSQNTEEPAKNPLPIAMQVESPKAPQREEQVYEKQILELLFSSVRKAPSSANYFGRQPDVTEHMRMVLLNWLIDVHLKYKLQQQTLFIAVNILDEFLRNQTVHRKELQLLGISALWIAAKYQQTYQVPKLANLVFVCDSAYTEAQILQMESRIILQVKFDFLKITSLTLFQSIARFTELKRKDYFLGLYLLEGILFEIQMQKHDALVIAASVIFFIQKLRGYKLKQEHKMTNICNLDEAQLRSCSKQLFFLWQKLGQVEETSSLRSKYLHKNFMEVAKIKMSQKASRSTC